MGSLEHKQVLKISKPRLIVNVKKITCKEVFIVSNFLEKMQFSLTYYGNEKAIFFILCIPCSILKTFSELCVMLFMLLFLIFIFWKNVRKIILLVREKRSPEKGPQKNSSAVKKSSKKRSPLTLCHKGGSFMSGCSFF